MILGLALEDVLKFLLLLFFCNLCVQAVLLSQIPWGLKVSYIFTLTFSPVHFWPPLGQVIFVL